MKRAIVLAIGLFGFGAIGPTFAQQVPGRGFSALLCLVQQVGVPGNAQIGVTIDSDSGADPEGNGTAVVTITHGAPESGSGSTHTVLCDDTNSSGDQGWPSGATQGTSPPIARPRSPNPTLATSVCARDALDNL
jgi:hypothetical protein